ncbi:MAG: hypothetical protein V1933_07415 [Candidatus Omnitrophota bacterium]
MRDKPTLFLRALEEEDNDVFLAYESPFYPPSQKTPVVKPWMNAIRRFGGCRAECVGG